MKSDEVDDGEPDFGGTADENEEISNLAGNLAD